MTFVFVVFITSLDIMIMGWVTHITYKLTKQASTNPFSSKSRIFYGRETTNSLILSIVNFFYIIFWPICNRLTGKYFRFIFFVGLDFPIYSLMLVNLCAYKHAQDTNKICVFLAGSIADDVYPKLSYFKATLVFVTIASSLFSLQCIIFLNQSYYWICFVLRISVGAVFIALMREITSAFPKDRYYVKKESQVFTSVSCVYLLSYFFMTLVYSSVIDVQVGPLLLYLQNFLFASVCCVHPFYLKKACAEDCRNVAQYNITFCHLYLSQNCCDKFFEYCRATGKRDEI